jgi:membrane-bound lytic murein transglycosylase A
VIVLVYCRANFFTFIDCMIVRTWGVVLLCFGALAGGCASVSNAPSPAPAPIAPPVPEVRPETAPKIALPPLPPETIPVPGTQTRIYLIQDWKSLPGWDADNPSNTVEVFRLSCASLREQPEWRSACDAASAVDSRDSAKARRFFESSFIPYLILNKDGTREGLITGYYEPLLKGSRTPNRVYRYPIYGVPDDLLVVDLVALHPDLKGVRLRGRLEGNRVVPYYSRAEIERGDARVRGREILWVDDVVELFFLQIQGSGRVELPGGSVVRIGFAEHNGHPFRSIGRILIERGEISPDKASMQGIKHWAKLHPDRLAALLQENPAFVFFREMPASEMGPIGAQGVALTPGRSIAVDPTSVPLGAPVFLSTTWPLSTRPLNRLVVAQDSGSAIKGAVRADFFWGFGEEAGQLAGRMRQSGRLWVLYPRGFLPPGNLISESPR